LPCETEVIVHVTNPKKRKKKRKKMKTLWLQSASKLYRPRDRHLSVKLVPTFDDRECHGSLRPYSRPSRPDVTNPTLPTLRSNPGRRSGKPSSNCLSYGTLTTSYLLSWVQFILRNVQSDECFKTVTNPVLYRQIRLVMHLPFV
jgi:hypothetical protein